jgi:hypothetical protein
VKRGESAKEPIVGDVGVKEKLEMQGVYNDDDEAELQKSSNLIKNEFLAGDDAAEP